MTKQTKIIFGMGPATLDPDILKRILGDDTVVRINTPHMTPESYEQYWELLRSIDPDVQVMTDVPGPRVRCGNIQDGAVDFEVGDELELVYARRGEHTGTKAEVSTYTPELIPALSVGDEVGFDEGRFRTEVISTDGESATLRAVTSWTLKNNKGINTPGLDLPIEPFTPHDKEWMELAKAHGSQIFSVSFIETEQDMRNIRKYCEDQGYSPKLCAKVETMKGLENIEEIARESDMVMIARGDGAYEWREVGVFRAENLIIEACKKTDTEVILATGLCESMERHSYPTIAEQVDLSYAFSQDVDYILFSRETAIGEHPVEAVEYVREIRAKLLAS